MGVRNVDPDRARASSSSAESGGSVVLAMVPVRLFRRSEQHADDVLRELALMAQSRSAAALGAAGADLVRRASAAVEVLRDLRAETAVEVASATERGDATTTLRLSVSADEAAAVLECAEVLHLLAGYCAAGALLTGPPPPDVVRFRRWWADEIARQSAATGRQPAAHTVPVPWSG